MNKYKIVYILNGEEKVAHIKARSISLARIAFEANYFYNGIISIEEVKE